MKPNFEIKYIEIQWYDEETVTKVTESLSCLPIEYNDETRVFECETTIYPNTEGLRGQLGVRFFDNEKTSNPYLELPDGEARYLSSIKDIDTAKTWWIVKDSWDKENKYWRHTGINTAGTLKLALQEQACHILIGSIDFTREQLEEYLADFKDDLWALILDDSSAIQADKSSGGIGVNEAVIDSINHLISYAEKVLEAPKVELREIQALMPRKAVKPVNRTFREIVSKTNQRYLTSRATMPSYNVSENRYILFALERSYRIIKQIVILSHNKSRGYASKESKLRSQYNSFSDSITVDRDLAVKDLEALRERAHIEYWQQKLLKKLRENNINLIASRDQQEEIYIRTKGYRTDPESEEKNGFYIEVFNNGQWRGEENKHSFLSFKYYFPKLVDCLEPDSEYRIVGVLLRRKTDKAVWYWFSSISIIELRTTQGFQMARKKFIEERQLGVELNKNGWKRKLNRSELDEQEKEKAALLNRINYYCEHQKLSEYIFKKVEPKKNQILKVIKSLRELNIKPSSHFPNSMTFVQNPNYQGVHNGYRILKEVTNLADDDLLASLEEIDSIGLVNMPLLYERWCLLQIIKVLTESFCFVLQDGWKYQLIDAVKTKNTDIQVKLMNVDSKRYITLTYEKTLVSGKRPDFVIDLEWYAASDIGNDKPQYKRFVLDAKFYNETTFERFGGLLGVVDQLYNKKDYKESTNNPVFVIHPCKSVLPERVTSQEWGKYSYLGELPIGGDEPVNHQYGGVFLNPVDRQIYADELQRLLGLFLQYKLEDSCVNKGLSPNDLTVSKPFCIRCGSSSLRLVKKASGYYDKRNQWVIRTTRSVWLQCNNCEQFISFNHCSNTGTRLIKNGTYWTYHSARAIEPFNIKCPGCGEWGSW